MIVAVNLIRAEGISVLECFADAEVGRVVPSPRPEELFGCALPIEVSS